MVRMYEVRDGRQGPALPYSSTLLLPLLLLLLLPLLLLQLLLLLTPP
jgi:hypothetical protein